MKDSSQDGYHVCMVWSHHFTLCFVGLTCPVNSHYELCTHTCDVSCSGVSISTSCTGQCSEGCECDDGYLFDAAHCVSMENCGCFYNGRYYHVSISRASCRLLLLLMPIPYSALIIHSYSAQITIHEHRFHTHTAVPEFKHDIRTLVVGFISV